jgi:GNAT superfamily N-acetyltransferase
VDKTWTVRINDDLDSGITEKAARFLLSFSEDGAEPVWSADHFRWKLGDANPAGRGFMTVATCQDEVIGVTTVTRKRWWDGQREVAAAEIGDTYSHPDFRREGKADSPYTTDGTPDEYLGKSVFGRLVSETRDRAEQAGISLIYGTPNDNSMPGYVKRLRFFDYESHFNRYFMRPGTGAIVERLPFLRPLQTILYGIDRRCAKSLHRLANGSGGLQCRESSSAGEEFDDLWHRLAAESQIGPLRDARYFRHRFLENPLGNYRVHALYQAGVICGVFVTRNVTQVSGLQVCYLAEWLLDPDIDGIFRYVVGHMISEDGGPDTKTYAFWAEGDWAASQGLARLGCAGKGRVPIIFFGHPDSLGLEASHTKMHFTLATSDNI